MNKIFNIINKKEVKNIPIQKIKKSDIVLDLNKGLMGIVLGDEILFHGYKKMSSFKVKIENLSEYNLKLLKSQKKFNKNEVQEYFKQNKDNPYAMQLLFKMINSGKDITNITQFPPTEIEKTEERFDNLVSLSKIGDLIFTFEKRSNGSRLIRKFGKCQWSHVGILIENKNIWEMTLEGIFSGRNIEDMDWKENDIAIYRLRKGLDTNKLKESINEFPKEVKYGWKKVILIAMGNMIKKRLTKAPTINDLIHSGELELVAFC